jgi:hypothetical protein
LSAGSQAIRLPAAAAPLRGSLLTALLFAECMLGAALVAVSPVLALGIAGLAAVVAVCVLAPRLSLLVLAGAWAPAHVLLSGLTIGSIAGIELNLSRALGVAVVAGFGSYLVVDSAGRRGRVPLPTPLAAQAAFVLLFAAATALAPVLSDGAFDLIRLASGVVILIAAFRLIDTGSRLESLAKVVTVSGVAVALVTITQFALLQTNRAFAEAIFGGGFYVRGYAEQSADRVHGLVGSPSATAGVLLAAAAFALLRYGILRDRGPARAQGLAVIVIGAGVFVTLTRAAIAALVVLVAVWALARQLRRLRPAQLRLRIALICALLACLAIPAAGTATWQARLWDTNPLSSGSSFAQGRAELWASRIDTLQSSTPLELAVGHGAHSSYAAISGDVSGTEFSSHNLILWLLVETGLVGLALYLFSLAALVPIYRRAARLGRFTLAGQSAVVGLGALAAFLVLNMFQLSTNVPAHGWYFMLLFGATLRAATNLEESA